MDIPNDKSQQSAAPTPMNSLANGGLVNPGTSVAPRVATLGEEDESGANPASMLSRNPNFLSLLAQNQQGADASSLPPAIRKRVQGLQGVQAEHAKIESEFQLEILALEKKFAVRYAPLYQRRSDIVAGVSEPTEAELSAGADEDDDEETDANAVASTEEDKGIPDFWLIALRNHVGISELITEDDEDALHHLRDIQLSYLEATKPGFKLTFVFDTNDYFENTKLEKVYYYQEEVGYGGDLVYDRAEGTEIVWKEDKDLTRKVEIKKQRNKTTNRTRVVKVVKPSDSFFNFFKPPTPPSAEQLETGDVDEAELQELDERLELDYQIGEDLKERIIPRAVDYYSGKALEYEGIDDESDDEFDEDEDAYGTDDEDDDAPRQQPAPGSQDPQECKQQ